MREEHIVPLSKQADCSARELQTYTGGRGGLFPNDGGNGKTRDLGW
ncbi:hypothetical protein PEC301879_18950 [Pectobacterium carotovorum subsp. carotovorum]|nr:hypothetical protein PEC301879_18950 [Pectobacterium carotovorum subsp. carotovorum]